MASQTRVWQTGDSWHKLAYAYYEDSREFRQLIELNPNYDIRVTPASGSQIYVTPPNGSRGKTIGDGAAGSPGTLNQLSTALNLSSTSSAVQDAASAIFPWDNLNDYVVRLSNYTAYSLLERDRLNGYALDSPQASSDTQRG